MSRLGVLRKWNHNEQLHQSERDQVTMMKPLQRIICARLIDRNVLFKIR
jgi:hypothetical protein